MTSRIAPTTMDTAPEAARDTLAAIKRQLGMVPNLFATFAHSPAALQGYLALDGALAKGALSKREIEVINLHVSELNGCGYCVSAHVALGGLAGLSKDAVGAARAGSASTQREAAILALVRRVVRTGGSGAGADLAAAREAGLTDAQIIEVLGHVALKTFSNTVALVAQTEVDFPKAPRMPQG